VGIKEWKRGEERQTKNRTKVTEKKRKKKCESRDNREERDEDTMWNKMRENVVLKKI